MTLKDSSEKTDVHNPELVLSDSFSFFHITAKSFGRKETWASQMAQWWRICLPTPEERQVQCLGWEDLLEKAMGTYCSILAWRIPWTEEPGGLQSMGSQRDGHDLATKRLCKTQKLLSHLPLLRNLPKEMLQQNKEANQEEKGSRKEGVLDRTKSQRRDPWQPLP